MGEIGSLPHRSDRSFIWLGKIVKSFVNKTLNYESPDWPT